MPLLQARTRRLSPGFAPRTIQLRGAPSPFDPGTQFPHGKIKLPMTMIQRRKTVTAVVGGVRVGSDAPIVVQSMTNTDTADIPSTVQQCAALARAGSELVRVTVNNEEAAAAVPRIVEELDKQGVRVPIIGDFHYNGHVLLTKYPECARDLAKYR